MEQDRDTRHDIPVGNQSMRVSADFVADYEQAARPAVIAERVWIDRKGEGLRLHVGHCFVVGVSVRCGETHASAQDA